MSGNGISVKNIKYYGRYRIVILISFAISFFSFYYYNSQRELKLGEAEDAKKYTYDNCCISMLYKDDIDFDDINYLEFTDCVISIKDMNFYVGDADMPRLSSVVMPNSELLYPIISGHYPTAEELADEHCAILGKKLKKYTFKEGKRDYVLINKEKYLVTGFVSTNNSVIADYSVFVFYENIGNNILKYLETRKNNYGIEICYQSNSMKTEDMIMRLEKISKEHRDDFFIRDEAWVDFAASDAADAETLDLAVFMYLFSIIIILLNVFYWFVQNKKAIAIMRIYGFSNIRICFKILSSFLIYMIIAIITSFVLVLINNLFENELFYKNYIRDIGAGLIESIKYILMTFLVLYIYVITILNCNKNIELLKNK